MEVWYSRAWDSQSSQQRVIYRLFIWAVFKVNITMMSWWARWRLKSLASPLFTPPFIQAQIKENIKAPNHWPFWNSPMTGEYPAQMASNAEMFPFDDVIMIEICLLQDFPVRIPLTMTFLANDMNDSPAVNCVNQQQVKQNSGNMYLVIF